MNKRYFILTIILLILSITANAQLRHGSCNSKSQSKLYITPYVGFGGGQYSYDLNKTLIGPGPDSTVFSTSEGGMLTPVAGLHIVYNIGKVNIGGGAEWEGMFGTTKTDINSVKHSSYFYKFYARVEYAFYSDAFSDIGMHLHGGVSFPNNVVGNTNDLGTFALGGLYYNLVLNSKSAFLFSVDYEYSIFNSTIGSSISKHTLTPIKFNIGYRFWI